jgi:hypothetical protein
MSSTEHDRKEAGELRGRLPSNGSHMDELVEVPQLGGAVLVKRRGDLDFNDISARARAADDMVKPKTRSAKERIRDEVNDHRAELHRLKKLRDKKGSRNLGKVSLPPKGSGIAWIPRLRPLLRSRVWASLGIYHHRMLAALECEHANHGGKQNGELVFTYEDGERAGIPRRYFNQTLTRLIEIGLVNREHRGRYAGGAFRDPSRYRLTYVPQKVEELSGPPLYLFPSNEWIEVELEILDGNRALRKKRQPPTREKQRPAREK